MLKLSPLSNFPLQFLSDDYHLIFVYLILDASAFLSGRINSIPVDFDGVITTSTVRDEVDKGKPGDMISHLLDLGLEVRDPLYRDDAIESARDTGDLDKLSEADLDVISLAMEIDDVLVVTDDFGIQNVLKSRDIPFVPGGEIGDREISSQWKWTYRCTGCGRYFDEMMTDCPVCGSPLKKTRKM